MSDKAIILSVILAAVLCVAVPFIFRVCRYRRRMKTLIVPDGPSGEVAVGTVPTPEAEYLARYICLLRLPFAGNKHVKIRPSYHERIREITRVIGRGDVTITAYVDKVWQRGAAATTPRSSLLRFGLPGGHGLAFLEKPLDGFTMNLSRVRTRRSRIMTRMKTTPKSCPFWAARLPRGLVLNRWAKPTATWYMMLPLGSDTEHFIQVFRRNLPGVFGYIRGHKYIGFFRNFFSFRFYGSLWPGVARVEDKAAPADDLLPAGRVFGNDPVCRFVTFHPPQAEKRPQGIPHGKEGQQPQRPVHRSSALGCREATASRSSDIF